jgi:hypothetical protein
VIDTDRGCISGECGWRPKDGEQLKLEGKTGTYQGQPQFKFTGAMIDIPVVPRDQLKYVAERTAGVGPAMEEQIWDVWGADWMTDVAPEIITRLSGKVYKSLREAIDLFVLDKEKSEAMAWLSEAMAWLMGKGATLALSSAAWEKWDKQTISIVQTDCYQLANLPNFGFSNVDNGMRIEFGIGDQDPRRIKAAVVYSMGNLTSQGSTLTTWGELRGKCCEVLRGMYTELISAACSEMFGSGVLRPFAAVSSVALGRDFENENDIWEFVNNG